MRSTFKTFSQLSSSQHLAAQSTIEDAGASRASGLKCESFWDNDLYEDLYKKAKCLLWKEDRAGLSQPGDLLHDAYVGLSNSRACRPSNREHLAATAVVVMKHRLIDNGRVVRTRKRFGQLRRVNLTGEIAAAPAISEEMLCLQAAIKSLQCQSRRWRVVRMYFYEGMTIEEIAAFLSVSGRTAKRDLRAALCDMREYYLLQAGATKPVRLGNQKRRNND